MVRIGKTCTCSHVKVPMVTPNETDMPTKGSKKRQDKVDVYTLPSDYNIIAISGQ